jgi:hypothetical protein
MAFSNYETLGRALKDLQIAEVMEPWLAVEPVAPSDYFRSELDYRLREMAVDVSEQSICESLLFPVLAEGLKPFADTLALWSHATLYAGDQVLGVPDYFIAKKSPLSPKVLEMPLAMIMEAKRNDFALGWGQCLAAMHAAQLLNGEPQRVVYGGTSDGHIWQFAKLQANHLTRHPVEFTLSRLDELFGALHVLFELCKQQVLAPASAA